MKIDTDVNVPIHKTLLDILPLYLWDHWTKYSNTNLSWLTGWGHGGTYCGPALINKSIIQQGKIVENDNKIRQNETARMNSGQYISMFSGSLNKIYYNPNIWCHKWEYLVNASKIPKKQ